MYIMYNVKAKGRSVDTRIPFFFFSHPRRRERPREIKREVWHPRMSSVVRLLPVAFMRPA